MNEGEAFDALVLYAKKKLYRKRKIKYVRFISDKNRKWKILQYLWDRGALDPFRGVTAREIADAMEVSISSVLHILKKLKGWGMVEKVGLKNMKWFLTERGIRFAEKWGGFLNHPWIKENPYIERVMKVRVKE